MKVDTKSVSFQILTLTDWHRPTLISCRISRDQHQISVRDTSQCHQPNQVSVLSVLANPSLHRGEKRLIWIFHTKTIFFLFVWNISKYSIQQARHADPPQQLQTSVDSTLHYQKHYPWVIDLCLTSHIQPGVLVCGWSLEQRRLVIKIIEHSQLTRSD